MLGRNGSFLPEKHVYNMLELWRWFPGINIIQLIWSFKLTSNLILAYIEATKIHTHKQANHHAQAQLSWSNTISVIGLYSCAKA